MTEENKCPDNGYYNSSTGQCYCNEGYIQADCSQKCSPGEYGFACSQKCVSCSIEDCDHVNGCPIVSTTFSQCSPGEYGFACSQKCVSCSIEDCDHVNGCPIVSTTFSRIPSTSTDHDMETSPDTGNGTLVVISIVSVASTVIVVGLFFFCCFRILRERKKRSRNRTNEDASAVFLMPGVGRYGDSNNSENIYNEPNFYESDVTSARDKEFPVDSRKFETRVNGTPEVGEEHYNHITLKIDLNPKYVRDNTDVGDMYSHIKTKHPPSRVLTDNQNSHVAGDFSP